MKRIVLSLALVFLSAYVFAGGIKVTSGNKSVLKESAVATLEFDYSETRWEKKDSYKERSGEEYENRVRVSIDAFKNTFNTVSKENGLIISDSLDAKYKMVFKVKNLEQHQGGGMWGRLYMAVTGTIDIIDLSSNNSVCTINIDKVDGNGDYTMPGKIEKAFSAVATKLVALKK